MKKLVMSVLCCCFLICENAYFQIPEEFHGTYRVKFDFPLQEVAEQVYEAIMDIPDNFGGITLYDNDLSVGNIRNSTMQGTVIRPRRVTIDGDCDVDCLKQALRKNSFQVVDNENNETYDPDDMTLIINANSIYKKNNNTEKLSLVYKLKESDTATLIHNEKSSYDNKTYYEIKLEKNERFYLLQDIYSEKNECRIVFGYSDGHKYISFHRGLMWSPFVLYPIKDAL